MKILIGGDFAPKKIVSSMIKNEDYSFFDELKSLTEKMDISIINMESPFVEPTDKPIEKWGPNLGCPCETVNALKHAGIDIVTLANNHIMDYGKEAMYRTIDYCHKNGIKTVGAGDNLKASAIPLIFESSSKRIGIINCCEHEFSISTESSPGTNPIDAIAQYNAIQNLKKGVDHIIVIVHGGHEQFNLPSPRMQQLYRFYIDAGADVVINHHQHCFSGYEIYKNKPIFYGLGNLCFEGSQRSPESWYKGYLVELDFSTTLTFKIHPYTQFSESNLVKLLTQNAIDEDLHILNSIIEDEQQLKSKVEEYYRESLENTQMVFEPYTNPILMKLKKYKLLPSFFYKMSKLRMTNHLLCESHFDKVKYFFNKTV